MTSLVVDTSALVAIVTGEPGADWLTTELAAASARSIAAPTLVELGIVLESRTPTAYGIARRVVRDAQIEIVPFDDDLADRATEAWRSFGKGRHPAALNFGDCFSYALAVRTGADLLCVGADFSSTDLPVRTPPRVSAAGRRGRARTQGSPPRRPR